MSEKEEFYSIEMTREGDEFIVAYWMFDDLEEARAQLEILGKGCTAYDIQLEIRNNMNDVLSRYQMGDEENPGQLQF